MMATNACPECGDGVPGDAPLGLCPRCLIQAATTATAAREPASQPPAPAAGLPNVDFATFRAAASDLGLVTTGDIDRAATETAGDAVRLARRLVRDGRLTPYQAGALLQGKPRGLLIGSYLILDRLGVGGMGVVFRARHRPSGRIVALKMLPPSFSRDEAAVRRFRREFQVASRLSHPNLVAAIEASEDRNVHFLTMDYIEGYDLERLVNDGGPMAIKLALHCAIQIARGLEAAHAQGVVHRDIKPANVMIDATGLVRVLDLGLARVIEATSHFGRTATHSLTQTGSYMGTVDFLSPEQADDAKRADHRADIYSLGCTLCFLLTGHPPFKGDTVLKRLLAHQEKPAPPLREPRPEIPEALDAIYLRMMAKRPDDRPQTMAEVILALEACRASSREAGDASADLKTFARTVMKGARPHTDVPVPEIEAIVAAPSDPSAPLPDSIGAQKRPVPAPWRRPPARLLWGAAAALVLAIVAFALYALRDHGDDRLASAPAIPPSSPAPPAAPDLDAPAVLYADDFKGAKYDWYSSTPEELAEGVVNPHGYRDGIYYAESLEYGMYSWHVPCTPPIEFEIDTRARVVAKAPEARGSLALHLFATVPGEGDEPRERGIQIRLDSEGRLYVEASFWTVEALPDGPWTGPITHPAIRLGGEWNDLRVRVRHHRMEIVVNSVPVCDIAGFDWDLIPSRLSVGVMSEEGDIRAEFDRYIIRELIAAPATPDPPAPWPAIYTDEFDDPDNGWVRGVEDMGEGAAPNRRDYERSLYFQEVNENWAGASCYDCTNLQERDYQVRLVGRVSGKENSAGAWGLIILNRDNRGFQVSLDRSGALYIDPAWQGQDRFPLDRRYLGPVVPSSMRRADEWNTLTLRINRHRIVVLVNGEAVGKPIDVDWDLIPSVPQLAVFKPEMGTSVRADYDFIEIRELPVAP